MKERGDAAGLKQVSQEARERYLEMTKLINEAEAQKAKILNNPAHDTLESAKRAVAFDRGIETMAKLAENAVSEDAATRLGEVTPKAWANKLTGLENDAKQSGENGKLALAIDDLGAEVEREQKQDAELSKNIEAFGSVVPLISKGPLGPVWNRAHQALQDFRDNEIGAENSLSDQFTSGIKQRISDELFARDNEFHDRRNYYDSLNSAYDNSLRPAYELAQQMQKELGDAVYGHNSDGKNGFIDKLASANAKASEANVREEAVKLSILLHQLDRDLVGVARALPSPNFAMPSLSRAQVLGQTFGDMIEGFTKLSSQRQDSYAQVRLQPILEALSEATNDAYDRLNSENDWRGTQINQELAQQKARARSSGTRLLQSVGAINVGLALLFPAVLSIIFAKPRTRINNPTQRGMRTYLEAA